MPMPTIMINYKDEGNEKSTPTAAAATENAASSPQEQAQLQPQQLFDLSLIQQQQDQSPDQITLYGEKHEATSHRFPPLESLTTEDDNTSVSSVSTQGSIQRRSMFSRYWKKIGQEPPRYLPQPSSCDAAVSPTLSPPNSFATGFSFLATPPEHEAVLDVQVPSMPAASTTVVTAASTKTPSRRNVFPLGLPQTTIRLSSSAPSLSRYQDQISSVTSLSSSGSPRKTRSCSHFFTKQPSSSCLRESRFSPSKDSSISSISASRGIRRNNSDITTTFSTNTDSASILSRSSVRFDLAATSVRHFEPPQEHHAEDGWSEYFQ
jgi:hypothetical protein